MSFICRSFTCRTKHTQTCLVGFYWKSVYCWRWERHICTDMIMLSAELKMHHLILQRKLHAHGLRATYELTKDTASGTIHPLVERRNVFYISGQSTFQMSAGHSLEKKYNVGIIQSFESDFGGLFVAYQHHYRRDHIVQYVTMTDLIGTHFCAASLEDTRCCAGGKSRYVFPCTNLL